MSASSESFEESAAVLGSVVVAPQPELLGVEDYAISGGCLAKSRQGAQLFRNHVIDESK